MTCNNCKNEIDSDSLFCQYCGNKILMENTEDKKKVNSKVGKNHKVKLILTWVIPFISILACIFFSITFNNRITNYELQITSQDKEIERLKSNYRELEILNLYNKDKASYFDKIVAKAGSASNKNFFASNTVLRNPNKTRVVFYIDYSGQYTISSEAGLGIIVIFGNTSSGLVYADISYFGKGVQTITFTNDYNNEKIVIYCIGS